MSKIPPIQLEPKYWAMLQDILKKYPQYQFHAYGSRARHDAWQYSDLDLCIKGEISSLDLLNIEEAFENSDLPIFVEVVRWGDLTADFQQEIQADLIALA